jgi:hypothetical protein
MVANPVALSIVNGCMHSVLDASVHDEATISTHDIHYVAGIQWKKYYEKANLQHVSWAAFSDFPFAFIGDVFCLAACTEQCGVGADTAIPQ